MNIQVGSSAVYKPEPARSPVREYEPEQRYPVPVEPDFFKDKKNPFYAANHRFCNNCKAKLDAWYFSSHLENQASEISRKLYLCSFKLASWVKSNQWVPQGKKSKSFAIVSCLEDEEREDYFRNVACENRLFPNVYDELSLRVKDDASNLEEFKRNFDRAFAFIDQKLHENKRVYVHCRLGISRSATLMAAYLMKKNKWSKQMALYKIFEKRPAIYPHPRFLNLLSQYEKELKSASQSTN